MSSWMNTHSTDVSVRRYQTFEIQMPKACRDSGGVASLRIVIPLMPYFASDLFGGSKWMANYHPPPRPFKLLSTRCFKPKAQSVTVTSDAEILYGIEISASLCPLVLCLLERPSERLKQAQTVGSRQGSMRAKGFSGEGPGGSCTRSEQRTVLIVWYVLIDTKFKTNTEAIARYLVEVSCWAVALRRLAPTESVVQQVSGLERNTSFRSHLQRHELLKEKVSWITCSRVPRYRNIANWKKSNIRGVAG
ncbi:uncharacterized protein STEHIDRAFT_110022 [Stereum hirsutum FP-91666 SS1]|uniref:uncharacterized protein n=1 Tax=Stereum hirsutum (strain FP-91666) TaxID=721885 RepID=UPI000440C48B|nr:uncharacterized protein STEHIDRAFT_110022 [Stereum hirsutum FP-91666 SS1]EIM88231.1 hypothetical protein STEHIDRAFT_110022 [Stereum hirsutum FP-91666 SS1]